MSMTNEQREAIKICEHYKNILYACNYEEGPERTGQAINTVLSLIKEQQEEIGCLQKELNEENKRSMILANNDKFKEQVIDLMAEYIEKVTVDLKVAFGENMLWNRNEIKQYFTNLVEKE